MKKSFTELSVRTKLLVPTMLLLAVICVFVALYFPKNFEQRAYLPLTQSAERITALVVSCAEKARHKEDRASPQQAVDSIGRAENVHYLVVTASPSECGGREAL